MPKKKISILFTDPKEPIVEPEIKSGDESFLELLNGLAAMAKYDPEAQRRVQQIEADRQLEQLANQMERDFKRELVRREECRKRRLERERAEKVSRKTPRNGRGGAQDAPGATKADPPGQSTPPKKPV